MVNLLLEAVLRVGRQEHPNVGLYQADPRWQSKGWNEVHVAVAFDRTADLEVLLRKGKRETLDWRDKEGRTPFLLAATKGNIECAKILLESGADKNARSNDGRTALYRAVANGNCRMLEMLIEMDANPTISDDRGCSPLDIARDKDHNRRQETAAIPFGLRLFIWSDTAACGGHKRPQGCGFGACRNGIRF